jgi:hypothetical protein
VPIYDRMYLRGNRLNQAAYDTYIPLLKANNSRLTIYYDRASANATATFGLVAGEDLILDGSLSAAEGTITSWLWDLDGDGQYDDGSGQTCAIPFSYWSGVLGWELGEQYMVGLKVQASGGAVDTDSVSIPEPATLGILALGGLAVLRRRD